MDADGLPTTPARICLGAAGTDHCYIPPSDKYVFGLEPRAQTVAKLDGKDLVLFTARFSRGGSGTLTNLALLEERSEAFVNLLPVVQLSNQSEYKFWSLPEVSSLPVLATAEFIWDFDAKETHFAPHRYAIEVYVFDPKAHLYVERVQFKTIKKFPGLDDSDQIQVLEPEKPAILAALRKNQTH